MKWFRDAEIVRLCRWQIDFQLRMFHLGREENGGRENLPGNIKRSSCHAHMRRSWISENDSFPNLMCFWTLNSSVTIAQIEKRGQNTLPAFFFFCFKLLKHFHRIRGKKTSGSVTMSSVREFVSDFQHFSHTWCSLSHVEAQLHTRRWWVSDLKLIPFTHSVTFLIWELETRLVKTFQSFSILAIPKDFLHFFKSLFLNWMWYCGKFFNFHLLLS